MTWYVDRLPTEKKNEFLYNPACSYVLLHRLQSSLHCLAPLFHLPSFFVFVSVLSLYLFLSSVSQKNNFCLSYKFLFCSFVYSFLLLVIWLSGPSLCLFIALSKVFRRVPAPLPNHISPFRLFIVMHSILEKERKKVNLRARKFVDDIRNICLCVLDHCFGYRVYYESIQRTEREWDGVAEGDTATSPLLNQTYRTLASASPMCPTRKISDHLHPPLPQTRSVSRARKAKPRNIESCERVMCVCASW